MRLRIDDSRPPVDVAAGYKTNACKAVNYVRDRNSDRLAQGVAWPWRSSFRRKAVFETLSFLADIPENGVSSDSTGRT